MCVCGGGDGEGGRDGGHPASASPQGGCFHKPSQPWYVESTDMPVDPHTFSSSRHRLEMPFSTFQFSLVLFLLLSLSLSVRMRVCA